MRRQYFDALSELYRTDRARLLAFARGLCGDLETAEDAVQLAFERMLRRHSPPRGLRPFVYRSVRNASFDALRRRSRYRADELDGRGVDTRQETDDGKLDLLRGLAALPQRERAVVVLCVVVGYTAAEAGELLGTSPNTISTRRRRGLARLRRLLEAP